MAGYIFSINKKESLEDAIINGVYSTIINLPKNNIWTQSHEGTFADYITMKEGDNVYFFHNRKIYGIGTLININDDCKFLNFPGSDLPSNYSFSRIKKSVILNKSAKNIKNRMLCVYKPSPHFFKNGVDMDEVLAYNPGKFKMLRAFWRLSFIKIDDEENKALTDVILKNNECDIGVKTKIYSTSTKIHDRVKKIATKKYEVKSDNILDSCKGNNNDVRHEMALEAGILDYISNRRTDIFGYWDYISHQVVASPFKPVDYMDKMDIFGYKYISGYTTISKYLTIEIKKEFALPEDIHQIMKYVDWINQEYSFGDYNMIKAFLVAHDFPDEVLKTKIEVAKRNFIKGRRPVQSMTWSDLRLIKYCYNPDSKKLSFSELR